MKRLVNGELPGGRQSLLRVPSRSPVSNLCLRLTPERPDRPAGHSSAVAVAPGTERLSRRRHWLRPSSGSSGAAQPRLGLSGCEETAERGIKEAQMATTEMT